jgi:hypothetical protein
MKKIILVFFIFIFQTLSVSSAEVFSERNRFGLKNEIGEVIVKPIYEKMILLGDDAYIICKNRKFGVMNDKGEILVEPKFTHADRFFGRYVKLGNINKYGVFNNKGEMLLKPEYASIELLANNILLTLKDYKYGLTDFDGRIILKNVFDDIYMPDAQTLRVQYSGKWYEVKQLAGNSFALPKDLSTVRKDDRYKFENYDIETTVGYSTLTFTDYLIKMFSSVSPAHEETIDELLLSHGADTVSILIKMSWIPKYPLTFIKKYYSTLRTPNNGPLSELRKKIKSK